MQSLGRFGEAWAAGYLTRAGFRIVERNVRYRQGEIDLIAYDGDELVFIEVKCRRTAAFGLPQASITPSRFRHLAAAIDLYLAERTLSPPSYRVDVIAITLDRRGGIASHEHIRAVESPSR